jgi:ABC-type nitrate/sulfonate/bicarbonate transport system substrate-binding protein
LSLVGALVTACTAAATPSAAPSAAPTAATSAGASAAPQGELPKPEVTSIKIGVSAASENSQFAATNAVMAKIFEKYGLTATVTGFEGEGKAVAALQAGQIDMGIASPASTMSSQLTDVPLEVIAVGAAFLTDDLICAPAIKTAADVKGKKVAISTFGGVSHASALLALKSLKLSASDAVITQVGGQTARVAAIKGGSVDCGVVDKSIESEMLAAGLNVVAKVYEPPQAFARSSTSVTRAFLQKNPNTVLVALAATLEGQNLFWTDTAGTIQRFAQWTQSDAAKVTPVIQDFLNVGNRSMMWTDEVFTNAQKVIVGVNPDIIDVDIQKAQDKTILKKLLDIGFYQKIGNPATCIGWSPTKSC